MALSCWDHLFEISPILQTFSSQFNSFNYPSCLKYWRSCLVIAFLMKMHYLFRFISSFFIDLFLNPSRTFFCITLPLIPPITNSFNQLVHANFRSKKLLKSLISGVIDCFFLVIVFMVDFAILSFLYYFDLEERLHYDFILATTLIPYHVT